MRHFRTGTCAPGTLDASAAGSRGGAALAALLILCGLVCPSSAAAQERGEVRGWVVGTAGEPLRGVRVVSPSARRGTLTDSAGAFVIGGIAPGETELHFARIGFAPTRLVVTPAADDAPLRVVMQPTPLVLPGMEVTATPGSRDPLSIAQATSQLAGAALERELGSTIAQTLRALPGVAVRSMGPAASMPVLRGLTGDRVLVLQDGQRAADLAGSADDHGVTIDPLAAQRLEIVRGPGTLLYGNNAVGGVVNIISGDLPTYLPERPEGTISAHSESAFPGVGVGVRAVAPLRQRWVVALRGTGRTADDMRIPADPQLGDRLTNTDSRSAGGSLGLAHIGEAGAAATALRTYHFAYGLPVPPGSAPVELVGRRYEASGRGELGWRGGGISAVRVQAAVQDYGHDELDDASGDLLQEFSLRTHTADILLRQAPTGPLLEGAWGASLLTRRYASTGPEALTPPADSRGIGVFGFQEAELIRGGLALQLGGRVDLYRIASSATEKFGAGVTRSFQAFSGAAGLRLPISPTIAASVHAGRSFRAPTVEELFSGAAHAGTGAVELGDPTLGSETGTAIEAMIRARSPLWSGQLSVYRNAVVNFVHLAAVGDTVLYGATLPVLRYAQSPAVLVGIEGAVEWAATGSLAVGLVGDYLHATMEDGTPLSYMPPPRLGISSRWEGGRVTLGGDVHHELAQNRVGAADERPTPAHTILRLHAGLRFSVGDRTHSISLRAENLGNSLHREATSRIKDFAPGPGRNIAVAYRLYY